MPDERDASALGREGVGRGRVWTARELMDLMTLSDLAIETVTVSPTSIAHGEGVTFTVRVANRGDGDADGSSQLGVFVDQAFAGCNSVPNAGWTAVGALAASQSMTLTVPVAGEHFLAGADPHEVMLFENYYCSNRSEMSLDNNRHGPVQVSVKWPDVTVESLTVSPASPAAPSR